MVKDILSNIISKISIDLSGDNDISRHNIKKLYKEIESLVEEFEEAGLAIDDKAINIISEEIEMMYNGTLSRLQDQERMSIDDYVDNSIGPNPGRQELAVTNSYIFDTLYGGSVGGGKTFAILLRIIFIIKMCVDINNEKRKRGHITAGGRFLVLRKEYKGLKDFISKSFEIFPVIGGVYTQNNWTFNIEGNVFSVELGYIKDEKSFTQYQGQEYIGVYVDEIGQFNMDEMNNILMVKGRLRNTFGFPSDFFATANPGGPGHIPLQKMYNIPSGKKQDIIISKVYDGQIINKDHPKYHLEPKDSKKIRYRAFIPSTLKDNPKLYNTGYEEHLRGIGYSDSQISAMIDGDWSLGGNGMFDDCYLENIIKLKSKDISIPPTWVFFRGYDYGTFSPYAGLLLVKNNGKGNLKINGVEKPTPIGTVIVINEVYGGGKVDENKPFLGNNQPVEEQAKEIKKMEEFSMGFFGINEILPGYADGSIFSNGVMIKSSQESVGDYLSREGLTYIASKRPPGSRIQGWQKMRKMMLDAVRDDKDSPHLYITDLCVFVEKELRAAQYNEKTMTGDLEPNAADHALDVIRYNVHVIKSAPKKRPKQIKSRFG